MAAPQSITRSRRGVAIQVGAVLLGLLLVGFMTIEGSKAAFSDTTENAGNRFSTGDVTIEDDDGGVAVMFSIEDMQPDTPEVRCINVTYTGSIDAEVKMYASLAATELASYLDTVITIGEGAVGTDTFSCTNFVADGAAAYTGTLASVPSGWATGLTGFHSPATTNDTKSYRIEVSLQDNPDAQGLAAEATFTWEAQS